MSPPSRAAGVAARPLTAEPETPAAGVYLLPASFAQVRLWFLHRFEPESPVYNVPLAWRLRGNLGGEALAHAFEALSGRHETLRTTFAVEREEPVQVVAPPRTVRLPRVDLGALPETRREAELDRRLAAEARRAFDLAAGPLLRVTLFRAGPRDHTLCAVLHHAVADGWSLGVLARELSALYRASRARRARRVGRPRALDELPIQYGDYAAWQRERLSGELLERELAFWRERLGDAPRVMELPFARSGAGAKAGTRTRHRGGRRTRRLPAGVVARLERLAGERGVTRFMALLALFKLTLARLTPASGRSDVVVGTPVAGRSLEETEGLIGLFVNTLVLRTDLSARPTFAELLVRVREVCLDAFAHQELPFERLVEELAPGREVDRSPLVQAVFVLRERAGAPGLDLPGLEAAPLELGTGTVKLELALSLPAAGEGAAWLDYDADRLDATGAGRFLAALESLLVAAVEAPDRPVEALPLLGEPERHQLLREWSGRGAGPWVEASGGPVHRAVARRAADRPGAPAVVAGGAALSYGELWARARELASRLRRLGVGPEGVVALLTDRSPETAVAALAVLEAGGSYLPLDPAYPAERLAYMLADSGAACLLVRPDLRGLVPASTARESSLPVVEVELSGRVGGEVDPAPDGAIDAPFDAGRRAYVIYTSGSTGKPKGVEVTHGGLANLVAWHVAEYGVGPGDRATLLAGPAFDASVWELWPYLAAGASLHVPEAAVVAEPRKLPAWLAAEGITLAFLATPLAEAVLEEIRASGAPKGLRLRALLTGGDRLHRPPPPDLPFRLVNHYGPTESTVVTTAGEALPGGPAAPPIGRPIAGLEVLVLDRGLLAVPAGVPGELWVTGRGLARGYLARPGLSAERFVPDARSRGPGARAYRTGDLASWLPSGELEFLGRTDHQVKLRGFRIELGEIEATLADHPGVAAAAAAVREDRPGERRLVAYLVAAGGGAHPAPGELRRYLAERLPDYMVPAVYLPLAELPLDPNGKLDRRALPAAEDGEAPAGERVAPRSPLEDLVAGVWSDVLGARWVGAHEDFFELGGHSLLATRVVSRLAELTGAEVPLRRLFEGPTVAELAAAVEELRLGAGGRREPPIAPRRDRTAPAPASYAQERLWFLDRLEGGGAAYHVPGALRLSGRLDAAALARALSAVAARHETLRTRFEDRGAGPIQVVAPAAPVPLPVAELTALPEGRRDEALGRLLGGHAAEPFDLARGPLLRVLLIREAERRHVLALAVHHVVFDGWSLEILLRELSALYGAIAAGRRPALPEPPIQYADFAVWQRERLAGAALEAQVAYWRERLRGLPPVLELPADRPPTAQRSHRAGRRPTKVPPEVVDALRALARGRGASLYMVLLGAFQALLGRWAGTDDLAVGSPVAGRTRRELEDLVGLFVNTLVLRADLSGDPELPALVERVREVALDAWAHQDLPFERVVEELAPDRALGRSPLFQVLFILQSPGRTPGRLGGPEGPELEPFEIASGAAKLDLTLALREAPDGGLRGEIEYDRDLFDPTTATRLSGMLGSLIEAIAADPERRLSELPLLDRAGRHQLLREWSEAPAVEPEAPLLHRLVERQARRAPDAVALVAGGEGWSYGELQRRVRRLAGHLRSLGLAPEERVGVCLERSAEMVVALLAVLEAGGAYVTLDPDYPEERLALILEDAGAGQRAPPRVLTRERLLGRLPLQGAGCALLLERLGEGSVPEPGGLLRPSPAAPEGLAYLLYTSGSTGRPKGVAVTHASAAAMVAWARREFSPAELSGVLASTSINFDLSVFEMFVPLAAGGTVVLAQDALALPDLPAASRVTLVNTVPSAMAELVRGRGLPASVLTVNLAGEPLKRSLADGVYAAGGVERVLNLYGPSEDTTYSTWVAVPRGAPGEPTIGRPVAGTRAYVLDRRLRPVPPGGAGELGLAGRGLARCYLGRPAETAVRFVPDPYAAVSGSPPGGRIYRTGDLARWLSSGELGFLGRQDHQVKLRGFRIELGEVEAVLASHPCVREAVAVVREDRPGDRRLVAYVVPREGGAADPAALRSHLVERLPEHMVPAHWVALEALPLSPTGKVDRRALPAPEDAAVPPGGWLAPRSPLEELVAGVWSEVLGGGPVGAEGHFFHLGGHSLLATRVVSRLAALLGVEVPLRRLFEGPTVAELAAAVEELRQGGSRRLRPPLVRRPAPDAPAPASFAQERLWFLDRLEGPAVAYTVAGGLRLAGPLVAPALGGALGRIVDRHEALRTRLSVLGERVVQQAAPARGLPLPVADLSGLPAGQREPALERLAGRLGAQPFDLARGPLLRALLVREEDRAHVLLLAVHHAVFDGWSLGVLFGELGELYAGLSAGRRPALPRLGFQYADYAAWQRGWLAGEALEEQLGFWRARLAGMPQVLELPADRPRPAVQSYRGGRERLRLPPELADGVRALAREQGATLFMVLLAGFAALLARITGGDDLPVGTPVAGRDRPELEGLIGLFVNTLVLRADLAGDPGFGDLVARVRETALDAWARQDLPFEKLVEELAPERALGHSPLFQVMFILQNAPGAPPELPGLEVAPFEIDPGAAKLDLTLALAEDRGGVRGEAEYDRDLFDPTTAARLVEGFRVLVESAVAGSGRRVSELALLAPPARHQLLLEWNDTGGAEPEPDLLHRFVQLQADRTPEAVALVAAGSGSWSYAEVDRRANRLARRLRRLGLAREERVGICLDRSPEMVFAILAVLEAGGAYVALDPDYPPERLATILEDAGTGGAPPRVLTRERFLDRLPAAARRRAIELERFDWRAGSGARLGTAERAAAGAQELAYLLFTSGSTGRPKGVALTHGSAAAMVAWALRAYSPAELSGVLASTSINFDLSVFELFVPLAAGGTVVLARDALELPELPEASRVTLVNTVPSAMAELVRAGAVPPAVRTVNLAGEPLKRSLAEGVYAAAEVERVLNLYGPSEDTTYSTWTAVPGGVPGEPTIGRPVVGTRASVLDRWLRPVPAGVPGELGLAGRGLARGYFGRPAQTAERFVPDPFSADPGGAPGGRLYRTGDLVRRLPSGELGFHGRLDHQVKLRGFRIELGEVETALLARPEVREAVAVVREDVPGDRRLVAYAVAVAGAAPAAGELIEALRRTLPDYMVPAAVVVLDELPLSPNRKVDRKALPPPEPAAVASGFTAPRDAVEAALAEIWSDVLGVSRMGIREGFFALGGHSLLATRVVSRAREVLGVELPLRELFEHPTIEGLAPIVRRLSQAPEAGILLPLARRRGGRLRFPASFGQERLWFLDRLDGSGAAYNVPGGMRLSGPLEVQALAAALTGVAARHEALRTRFESREGELEQVVEPAAAVPLPVVELTGLPEARRGELLSGLVRSWGGAPFDLARGPLLRALLVREAPEVHALLLAFHHAVFDGWSLGVLLRELSELYAAHRALRRPVLPELAVQYGDYATWQRAALSGELLEGQLAWWRRRLAGAPEVLELPADRSRPAQRSGLAGRVGFGLPPELAGSLRELARERGATLFMVLLAGFTALLSRLTGGEDLPVGSPVAGRQRSEVEGLIGFFVNTLVLRSDLSGDPSFAALVGRTRETALEAWAHQDLPFEKLVAELAPARTASHSPLVQVVFALQNTASESPGLAGLALEPLPGAATATKFDLTLALQEDGAGGLAGELEYARDLLDSTTARRQVRWYVALLGAAAAAPDRAVRELALLGAAERHQLLAEWNDTTVAYPRDRSVPELFSLEAARRPEAIAVRQGERWWSYGELDARSNRLASRLAALGVGPESLVGLAAERSPEMIAGLVGILKSGGAYLPLDPEYPPERLAFMLADGSVPVLVGKKGALDRLPKEALERSGTRVVALERALAPPDPPEAVLPPGGVGPRSLAYTLYTSGSTGRPKGVAVEHRSIVRLVRRASFASMGEEEVFLQLAPVPFDASTLEIWGSLLNGARLEVFPPGAPSLEELGREVEASRVSVLWLTAGLFHQMVELQLPRLAGVGQLLAGGDVLAVPHVRRVLAALGPGGSLVNGYGPTEGTTFTCCRRMEAGHSIEGESVPIGRPISNTRVYLVESRPGRGLEPVPLGVPGELYLGGDGVARGYLARPGQTSERFVPDPFAAGAAPAVGARPDPSGGGPGARLYRTGDLARWLPSGEIEFLGRLDGQVKLRGYRIELGEIESVLASYPSVRTAAVAVREDLPGDRRLVAYTVAAGAEPPAPEALRSHLAERLPGYMVPAVYVALPELPLDPNGKVDRKALPLPDADRGVGREEWIAPRGPLEELVAGVWSEILGTEGVGAHDDFFDLGGHSLLATRVISRLQRLTEVELPLRALFEHPTVSGLARSLEETWAGSMRPVRPPLVPLPREAGSSRSFALSYSQERIWFLDQLQPGSTVYNIPAVFRFRGALLAPVLARALTQVVRRHESLRTVFGEEGGRPVQRVEPAVPVKPPVIDLGGLPGPAAAAAATEVAGACAAQSFDLAAGPVFTAWLLRLGDREHRLAWCVHHVAADGWSLGILLREITALYDAWSRGRPSPLAVLPAQYPDFAEWQRRALGPEDLAEHLEYWRRRLEGAPRALELPADRPRPPSQSYLGARENRLLPPEDLSRLQRLAAGEGATLFMLLLAALGALLARWSGQRDLVIGAPVAGRDRTEVEELIGMFLNTLVLRLDLSGGEAGGPTFRELLRRAREVALGAYAHQSVQFEMLLNELEVERDLSRTPLFQVFLNVLSFPREPVPLEGLEVKLIEATERVESKFDLTLYAAETGAGLLLDLVYSTDLFDRPRMAELLDQLCALLRQAADAPDRPFGEYSLRTPVAGSKLPDPAEELSDGWEGTVYEVFSARAAEAPDRVAVAAEGSVWSYRALDRAAKRLARALAEAGADRGDRVAIFAQRSATLALAILGSLGRGAAYVVLDPTHPPRHLAELVARTRPRGLLRLTAAGPLPVEVAQALEENGNSFELELSGLGAPAQSRRSAAARAERLAFVELGPDDEAYVAFTSGTTGRPKGILGRHGPLSHFIPWQRRHMELGVDDRYSVLSGLAHDPLQRDLFTPLQTGATVCVPAPDDVLRPAKLFSWMQRERVSVAHLTPAMGQLLVSGAVGGAGTQGLSALRRACFVGEQLTQVVVDELSRLAPELVCYNFYGTTETQRAVGCFAVPRDAGRRFAGGLPLGRGMQDVQLLVLNSAGRPTGVGEVGEILVRSPHLARGYLNDPALTAERFTPDPFASAAMAGSRVYRTGDLGRYRTDGAVEYGGRADDQVQVRGFRVELAAVEAALAEHPRVAEAAVSARPGPGGTRLVGYLVPAAGAQVPGTDEMRSHLAERLPDYMVPALFVSLEALPLTPTAKVDRRALPEPAPLALAEAFEPPTSPLEEVLAGIWCEVLEIERVGRRDDFFRLGGHSLLAVQIASRARSALAVDLGVRDLFECPTVAALGARAGEMRGRRVRPRPAPVSARSRQGRTSVLSFAQERLWFLERLGAGGAAYNMPVALELSGRLDAPALASALAGVVRRHEPLRTRFEAVGGEPRQVISPPDAVRLSLAFADLSRLGEVRATREAPGIAQIEAAVRFDLGRAPLVRALLVRLAAERHALVLTLHHVVSDGWSTGVLVRELAALYAGARSGEPAALPDLPLQFADVVRRQREELTGERVAAELDFWRRRLAGAPSVLDLPFDRPRPPLQTHRGARCWVEVPPRLGSALGGLGRERGLTPFMTLLAGLQALLWRVTGGQSPPVGTPIAGRDRVETEGLIGFFANTLVVYADLSDDPPFEDLLDRAREATLDAHDHQDLPFEKLVEELQPARNLSYSPLFQVMLVVQNAAPTPVVFPGLHARAMRVAARTARFDLILLVGEERGRLEVKVEYNRDLFDPTTVARQMRHLLTLMEAASADPGRRLSELPLLTPAERHHLVEEWNDTRAPYPRTECLHHGFEEWAAGTPDAVALEVGPRRITYGELAARSDRLARGLAALGVAPGSRVGIYLERGPELVVAVLAVLRAGGAYVPLEGHWPADRVRYILEIEGIRHLVTGSGRLGALAGLAGAPLEHAVSLDDPGGAEAPAGLRLWSPAALRSLGGPTPVAAGAGDLAYVIFTSGSTGRPKGVMVRHRPAVNLVHWVNTTFGVGPGDRLLFVTALSFDLSVYDLLGALAAGATVRIASGEELLDPQRQVRVLLEEPITFWDSAPAALQHLAPSFPDPGRLPAPPALRLVFLSGDWIPVSLPDRVRRSFAGARVVSLGGATEATVWSNYFPVGEVDPSWPSIPYGRPIANARYHVLDPRLEPCPVGVAGDLYIAGECLSIGYSGQPAQTAAGYVPDPLGSAPGGVFYRTGDRARYRGDGNLEFLGRLDTQVKVRGFRIELGEIEAVLSGHPQVEEAVVLAREDAPGDRRLVAYYLAGVAPPAAEELRRLAREKLPEYMVPGAFVALPAWPQSPTGKLDRKALPAPEAVREAPREARFVSPATGLERTIAAVWREVLGVERVGREESFFDLGGHSLLLARVQARLQEELAIPVAMVDLFRHPTVRSLARHLGGGQEGAPAVSARPAREPAAAADRRIAVVGLAGRFPGAKSVERFWENLCSGVESIRRFSDEELLAAGFSPELLAAPDLVKARGVLDDPDLFDAAFFGYSPREAQIMDPQQRLFLEVAWEALEGAGYGGEAGRGAVGVFAGMSENRYVREIHDRPDLVRAVGPLQVAFANNSDYLASRVSYKLGLEGPSVNVQTACSTSLVAVHLACQSLLSGECDLALAGGASVRAREVAPYRYEEGGTASPDGRLRAFDERAGGLVGGSGVGVVALKRLADALADGDTVRAVVLGTAANNDGARRAGFTAPGVEGQAKAIRAAQRAAGVAPSSIGYIEAHGTATALGDPIEIAALTQAFREGEREAEEAGGGRAPGGEPQGCAIGSVKTNVGHLDAAAGVAGLIKAVLALERGEIPPSLHFERPNPRIDFAASPFFVNTRLRPWPRDGRPRRAGVSSFGIGGTNAHAVLEEAPEAAAEETEEEARAPGGAARPARSAELLVLSARTEPALEQATAELARHLESHPALPLADVAWTLQAGRRAFPWRRAVVAAGRAAAPGALTARDRRWERSGMAAEEPPRVAFLFPGQGAQHPGMGEGLYREEPVFREALDRCSAVLEPELGRDLREALYPGSGTRGEEAADRLAATELTQPALFAVEYALARLWQSWGIRPAAMVGHSIGEWVAAALAGVFTLEDALRLVAARGRLMGALPGGAMLAVRLGETAVAPLVPADGPLALAAVNAPDACVLSGPEEAVAELAERLAREGIEHRRLHTSHAFHSPAMEPAVEPFRELVARVERRAPAIPFASNLTGSWITAEEATDPLYWARQLRSPVRFGDGLGALVGTAEEASGWVLLEVGPGRTLATLARRHPAAVEARAIAHSLGHPRQAGSNAERLLAALGALWAAGVEVDWAAHHQGSSGGRGRRRVPLPTYPFERRSHWLDGLPMAARSAERPAEVPAAEAPAGASEPVLSEVEAEVAEVWREVLGVERPAAGDDFFDLGGSSLMAVQLGGRLRQALGVELPSDFLLEAATLGEQAALVDIARTGASGAGAAAGGAAAPAPPPSCRVRLQRGAEGRPPLFAVHQVGGHVYSFRALAKGLGPAQPFYGLRSRGLEPGEGEPLCCVAAMAGHYLDLVREVQPAGPYRIAGASMGGMVAFEMAHRLREAGEEVALLALMDTPCGDQMPRRPEEPAEFTALIFAGVGLPLTYAELRPLDPDEQLVFALGKARAAGAVGPDFDLDQARRLRSVLEANVAALYDYRPRPYPGRMVFYRAEERRNQDSARPELAWIDLAHGGLDFVVVPGNHATMHEPPHVQAMADDLRRRLEGR